MNRSDLLVAAHALAPWEGAQPLPFAMEALRQLACDLRILRAALCDNDPSEGELCKTVVSRTIAGLAERADAAAIVTDRLKAAAQ